MQSRLQHLQKQKEKNATFKGKAKKTLLRTAQKAGLKTKSKKHKYLHDNTGLAPTMTKTMLPIRKIDEQTNEPDGLPMHPNSTTMPSSPAGGKCKSHERWLGVNRRVSIMKTLPSHRRFIFLSPAPHIIINQASINNSSKSLEKLAEMSYVKDFSRLGLGHFRHNEGKQSYRFHTTENYRISSVNSSYTVCRSYPGLVVLPYHISDSAVHKLARCYRHNRFPCIVWRHPRTRALLLRSSSFHGRGVIGMLKGQSSAMTSTGMASTISETSAHIEQEKFINAIINLTPAHFLRNSQRTQSQGSQQSLNSILTQKDASLTMIRAPDSPRKNAAHAAFQRAMNTLRTSGIYLINCNNKFILNNQLTTNY